MPLILLIAWIFAESLVIARMADIFGGLLVFAALALIAIIGARLIRKQGLRTLNAVNQSMQQNQLPAATLLDGVIVFVAGTLLILPGFISDAVAIALLFSGLRRKLAARVQSHLSDRHPDFRQPTVIDGEFQDVTPGEGQNSAPPIKPPAANEDNNTRGREAP